MDTHGLTWLRTGNTRLGPNARTVRSGLGRNLIRISFQGVIEGIEHVGVLPVPVSSKVFRQRRQSKQLLTRVSKQRNAILLCEPERIAVFRFLDPQAVSFVFQNQQTRVTSVTRRHNRVLHVHFSSRCSSPARPHLNWHELLIKDDQASALSKTSCLFVSLREAQVLNSCTRQFDVLNSRRVSSTRCETTRIKSVLRPYPN